MHLVIYEKGISYCVTWKQEGKQAIFDKATEVESKC